MVPEEVVLILLRVVGVKGGIGERDLAEDVDVTVPEGGRSLVVVTVFVEAFLFGRPDGGSMEDVAFTAASVVEGFLGSGIEVEALREPHTPRTIDLAAEERNPKRDGLGAGFGFSERALKGISSWL